MLALVRGMALGLAILSGCQQTSPSGEVTATQAIDIADVYVAKHYPFSRREYLRPVAHDQGQTWIVTYDLPEDSVGGTPTIEIDKRTSRVVYAHHTQ
ncbi:MAG: YbbC/YhhH family protein [Pseudomonadota bacterium]|nr:YbbC/YhhH family protein [Pseudomonadota bacterium]